MDEALALADWKRFDARAARVEGARQAARARHRDVPRMDRRRRLQRARDRDGERRRRHRDVLGDAGRWGRAARRRTRSSPSTCSACRSTRSASCRATPIAATGFGSAGSRSLFVGGSAVHVAASDTVDKAKTLAAQRARSGGERHRVRATASSASPAPTGASACSSSRASSRSGASCWTRRARSTTRRGRTAATSARSRSIPRPARSTSSRYSSVNDVGRVVNPMIVIGQLEGGALQGIGQALCERFVLRRASPDSR